MFSYFIEHEDNIAIVHFEGDMDIEATEIIEEELHPKLINEKIIKIDMSKVPFVDSSGIGLFITLVQSLTEVGIHTSISKISEDVKEVFSLLQVAEIIGINVFEEANLEPVQ